MDSGNPADAQALGHSTEYAVIKSLPPSAHSTAMLLFLPPLGNILSLMRTKFYQKYTKNLSARGRSSFESRSSGYVFEIRPLEASPKVSHRLRCLLYSYLHFSDPTTWNRLDGAVFGYNSDICQMLSTRGIPEPARSAWAEQMEEILGGMYE
jgi:hypothetical protein